MIVFALVSASMAVMIASPAVRCAFAVDVGAVGLDRLFVPAGVVDVVLCHFDQLPCVGVVFV